MIDLPADIDRDPAISWTSDSLRFADTDRNGHINNGAFAALAESGRVQLIDRLFAPVLPPHAFFVIARLSIDFHAELHFPGQVRTATWVSRIGTTSVTMHQAIVGGAGSDASKPTATAEAVCVLLDAGTRRPLPLPSAIREIAATLVPTGIRAAD
jgi:acyl-CoA thioester hydrolase